MVQNVWWTIFPYLGIPIHLSLHVVLGVDPNPDPATKNELIFTYQEDHIFWVESFLAMNPILTLGLGPLFLKHLRPLTGESHFTRLRSHGTHMAKLPWLYSRGTHMAQLNYVRMATICQVALKTALSQSGHSDGHSLTCSAAVDRPDAHLCQGTPPHYVIANIQQPM